jgi:hypothetical protein
MEKLESILKISFLFLQMTPLCSPYFLSIKESTKEGTLPIRNWGIIINQFLAIFGNGIELFITQSRMLNVHKFCKSVPIPRKILHKIQ